MCYKIKLALHCSTCAIKFGLAPGFSPKFLDISKICFRLKWKKIEINFIFSLLLCFKASLIYGNSHWNKTSTQTFHKITYNTIFLARRAIKFLDLNFLYISKVLAFLDLILCRALAKYLLGKEKISIQKLYITANQNNSVLNS